MRGRDVDRSEGEPSPISAWGRKDFLIFRSLRSGEDGAGGAGDSIPELLPGIGGGKVKNDPSCRLLDPSSDLQKLFAERAHLSASERGSSSAKAEFLEEDVRRRGLKDAELVGEESRATRPVDLEPQQ